jgi:hypothetical protein
VFGSEIGAAVEIKPGFHSFDFSCHLPADMPSSFTCEDGSVQYSIEAIFLSASPQNYNNTVKLPVHVISNRDYNHKPLMREPVSCELVRSYKLLCKSWSMIVHASLPRKCFVSSEVMPITIEINNQAGGTVVTSVTFELVEMTKLTSTEPKEIQRIYSSVLVQEILKPAPKPESLLIQKFITLPLLLRPVKYCKIIEVRYEIHVKLEISSCFYSFPTLKLPFEVGAITQKVSEL